MLDVGSTRVNSTPGNVELGQRSHLLIGVARVDVVEQSVPRKLRDLTCINRQYVREGLYQKEYIR